MKIYLKYLILNLLFFLMCFLPGVSLRAQNIISNYKVHFGSVTYHKEKHIVLRQFTKAGALWFLTVDPKNMDTKLLAASDLTDFNSFSFEQLKEIWGTEPYVKALLMSQANALPLQDAGITHAFPGEKGITLTIDLCPSHKKLDREIFTALLSAFNYTERPIPVALSLTGRFLFNHEDDIKWLLQLVSSGDITITWINHTYNHHYNPSQALQQNFLLEPGTDLNLELLALEQSMIKQGLVPSVFFRFPGLISNQKLVDNVTTYGLIPIGSDAWLAKGQQAKPGSLVLIHGNGNEPIGVQDFIKLLKTESAAVKEKQWLLYDLRSSISNEFE